MRLMLINPYVRSISDVAPNTSHAQALTWLEHKVNRVEFLGLIFGTGRLMVDKDRMFKPCKRYFSIGEISIAGCGLVIVIDDNFGLVDLQDIVKFGVPNV